MSRVELKIDGVAASDTSYMISAGKDIPASSPTDITIATKMANDEMDVCGFGKPISPALVKDIAGSYFVKSERAWKLLQDIDLGKIPAMPDLVADTRFSDLKGLLDPDKQIVSGVFGKEIILNIIGRKGCEGIRYIIGEMEGKMTIVLIGVKDVTKDGDLKAKSETLAGAEYYRNAKGQQGFFDAKIPPDAEVHGGSLTRTQIQTELGASITEKTREEIADFLLGKY